MRKGFLNINSNKTKNRRKKKQDGPTLNDNTIKTTVIEAQAEVDLDETRLF